MNNKKHIVYLGLTGFPYGLAEIQKTTLISKGLIAAGNEVTIIAKRGLHPRSAYPDLKAEGNFEGINYVYTSGNPFRSESFMVRNFYKVKGLVRQWLYLRKMQRTNRIDFAIISTHDFYAVLYNVILSKIFGFKTILNYVEFYSGIRKRKRETAKRINDYLFDKYAPRLTDAVFPISEFLIQHVKKVSPGKKYLKIISTDFRKYAGVEVQQDEKYFLFCGAANYKEIVKFSIDSFISTNSNGAFLYLVINGVEADIQEIKDYIEQSGKKEHIRFFSRLSEKELFNKYKNATALLIPLRPSLQDIARFPHKISEYLASGNPVVSTNYGEVKHFFKDMENMLIADSYEVKQFAEKMQFVLDNPAAAKKIGDTGKQMALDQFENNMIGKNIDRFLDEIK